MMGEDCPGKYAGAEQLVRELLEECCPGRLFRLGKGLRSEAGGPEARSYHVEIWEDGVRQLSLVYATSGNACGLGVPM